MGVRLSTSKLPPASTKNLQSRYKLLEESPSHGDFLTSSLAGTFEDQATILEKQRLEEERLEKFQKAKQQANSYLRKDGLST